MSETEVEEVELRLLSDAAYGEELDMVVNELTDQYVAGDFSPEDGTRFKDYFFQSAERRRKLEVARQLQEYAATPVTSGSNKLSHLWLPQGFTARAMATLLVVVAVGLGIFVLRESLRQPVVITATLKLVEDSRGSGDGSRTTIGPASKSDRVELKLLLPETNSARQFRAELLDERGSVTKISALDSKDGAVTLVLRATQLQPQTYAIKLYSVDNGVDQRINGSYFFQVK